MLDGWDKLGKEGFLSVQKKVVGETISMQNHAILPSTHVSAEPAASASAPVWARAQEVNVDKDIPGTLSIEGAANRPQATSNPHVVIGK